MFAWHEHVTSDSIPIRCTKERSLEWPGSIWTSWRDGCMVFLVDVGVRKKNAECPRRNFCKRRMGIWQSPCTSRDFDFIAVTQRRDFSLCHGKELVLDNWWGGLPIVCPLLYSRANGRLFPPPSSVRLPGCLSWSFFQSHIYSGTQGQSSRVNYKTITRIHNREKIAVTILSSEWHNEKFPCLNYEIFPFDSFCQFGTAKRQRR